MYLFGQTLVVIPKQDRLMVTAILHNLSETLDDDPEAMELHEASQVKSMLTDLHSFEVMALETYGYTNTRMNPCLLEYLPPPLIGG